MCETHKFIVLNWNIICAKVRWFMARLIFEYLRNGNQQQPKFFFYIFVCGKDTFLRFHSRKPFFVTVLIGDNCDQLAESK